MRNAYGGNCYKCGIWVAPGTGYFERVPGKGWRVQHCYRTHNKGVTCKMAADEQNRKRNAEARHPAQQPTP